MEKLSDIAPLLLKADTSILALIVALAAIMVAGIGFWAMVQISKVGKDNR